MNRREEIARRAYEISLTEAGGTPNDNWTRAERELASQYHPIPTRRHQGEQHACGESAELRVRAA